jgi:GH35 family endo-1,4-beta-xylanase
MGERILEMVIRWLSMRLCLQRNMHPILNYTIMILMHGVRRKRDGIVRLVKMLQKEGIRIDGVGMQGHWDYNYPKTKYIEEAIDAYAACGVKVMIPSWM